MPIRRLLAALLWLALPGLAMAQPFRNASCASLSHLPPAAAQM